MLKDDQGAPNVRVSPREDQVDDLSRALHNRTGQFILPRGSILNGDDEDKIIGFDKFSHISIDDPSI